MRRRSRGKLWLPAAAPLRVAALIVKNTFLCRWWREATVLAHKNHLQGFFVEHMLIWQLRCIFRFFFSFSNHSRQIPDSLLFYVIRVCFLFFGGGGWVGWGCCTHAWDAHSTGIKAQMRWRRQQQKPRGRSSALGRKIENNHKKGASGGTLIIPRPLPQPPPKQRPDWCVQAETLQRWNICDPLFSFIIGRSVLQMWLEDSGERKRTGKN